MQVLQLLRHEAHIHPPPLPLLPFFFTTQVPELLVVKAQLTRKYGKEFALKAKTNANRSVNVMVAEKLLYQNDPAANLVNVSASPTLLLILPNFSRCEWYRTDETLQNKMNK